MAEITVPDILQIPDKLYKIITDFNEYRYFLLEGGRGGGKSQAVGRFILFLAEKKNIRVVCGREIQNSIQESVYSLMADLINKYSLNLDVQASRITHRGTGSTINFRGFREQGAWNIQGMEGVDVVWIDESQAVTKGTLDVLIPTIRKENSKVFFTMNRHVVDDPVFATFHKRKDCLHININYDENPFCTGALRTEAEECRKISEKDYEHIWLGIPLAQSEDALFARDELEGTIKNRPIYINDYRLRLAGFDIARYGDDKSAGVVMSKVNPLVWEVTFAEQWGQKDTNYTTGRILDIANEQDITRGAIDEDGIGAGPLDTLNKGRQLDYFCGFRNPPIGYSDDKFYANVRTKFAYKLKELVIKGRIVITQKELIDELLTLRYTYDNYQRKILISKEKMRKDGVKSPNLADALIMAVSLIDELDQYVKETQANSMPAYSAHDNLLPDNLPQYA